MLISVIVAADKHNGIGYHNNLLCHMPADLKYFKQITSGHHIIMGRKTYDSIGKALPNRVNIIVSGNKELQIEGCIVKSSLEDALQFTKNQHSDEVFIIGGGSIYLQAIQLAHRIYITRIHHQFVADTFFPTLSAEWHLVSSNYHDADGKNAYAYSFELYEKNPV
jgi:dihydrofolate reductase